MTRIDREGPVHKAVLDYLRLRLPDAVIHHSPNETDLRGAQAVRMIGRAKALGMMTGWPDLEVIHRGRVLFIEVKAPRGSVSESQRHVGELLRAQGFRWVVVRSVDDMAARLDEWLAAEGSVTLPVVGRIS